MSSWLAKFIASVQIKFTMIFVDEHPIYKLICLSSTKAEQVISYWPTLALFTVEITIQEELNWFR